MLGAAHLHLITLLVHTFAEPRVDGPPFVDLHAKQGQGFDVDYDKIQKHLGPGKVRGATACCSCMCNRSLAWNRRVVIQLLCYLDVLFLVQITLADFMRDIAAINKEYIPSAHKSYIYLRIGSGGMMLGLVIMILMGIIGGTTEIRSVVMPLSFICFLVGLLAFIYSKWTEQSGIREGAQAVRKVLDDVVNPRYSSSEDKIRWTVAVQTKSKKTYHMGKTLLERPVISIYCLRSANADGVMTDWNVPESFLSGLSVVVQSK